VSQEFLKRLNMSISKRKTPTPISVLFFQMTHNYEVLHSLRAPSNTLHFFVKATLKTKHLFMSKGIIVHYNMLNNILKRFLHPVEEALV
jgi:hypothetical protein